MPIDFDAFVAKLVSTGEHWVFSVEGADWHWVLERIEDEFFPEVDLEMADFGTIFADDNMAPVCWARRARVPVEVVALRFGLTIAQVKAAKIIVLKPLPPLPVKPTVSYFGEA